MNEKITQRDVPVMQGETFKALQRTMRGFASDQLSPPEMERVYGAVRRPVTSNMICESGDTHYLSMEIVYRNGGAKSWQDSHREFCEVVWWAVLADTEELRAIEENLPTPHE